MLNINPKEAHQIIASLEGGVVPSRGIRHLLVGRRQEVDEILSTLERVKDGASDIRFWVGDFGSGKSFMLQTIDTFALEKDFVVSTVDLSPTRAFSASTGKARALYREIMNNLHIKTCQDRSCLEIVLQKWITRLREEWEPENGPLVFEILQAIERTFDTFKVPLMAYDFGKAVAAYAQGMLNEDREQKIQALRWLRAETDTKTEAKKTLGIGTIINDTNWFDALKTFDELVVKIGYAGLVVNFDELVNVYKLPRSQTRASNYEMILNMYNECKTGRVQHLFLNFGATRKTIYDSYRGLSSYRALAGRLGAEQKETGLVNTNRTVLALKPLTPEEIYTLLEHLLAVYKARYHCDVSVSYEQLRRYMEEQLNRPGADEFLTPRAVIKDFLELLDLKRQNPERSFDSLLESKFGGRPVTRDADDHDDSLEVF
ncbi:ATP-binding protein [uncultured Dubosiella sp.]|uniref:ATP-binding protein n=1 Tax=uncultured Dubosiella sp. TaxID=1937011 RepID=UPI0025969EF3|nr:ATP-binding protein [uncultured Dubosiella sp.]